MGRLPANLGQRRPCPPSNVPSRRFPTQIKVWLWSHGFAPRSPERAERRFMISVPFSARFADTPRCRLKICSCSRPSTVDWIRAVQTTRDVPRYGARVLDPVSYMIMTTAPQMKAVSSSMFTHIHRLMKEVDTSGREFKV